MPAFLESPRFPTTFRYGIVGGPVFNTRIAVNGAGFESPLRGWNNALGKWDLEHGPHSKADTDTLINFFRALGGRAIRFRFQDVTDYQVTITNGALGGGVGNGLPTYQLNKVYSLSPYSEVRSIKKPVAGTTQIYRNTILQVAGTGAGQYALDATTGIVTYVADATSATISITVGVTTQVVLSTNPGTLVAGKLLYLTGFSGIDATLVNGLAHTINSVTGSGPYTFTLATNTAGKTITLGSGQGRKYPQVSETLTWSGEFDVPVRFAFDEMSITADDYNSFIWHNVQIVEVRL